MSSIRRFLVIVLLATITLINFLAALHGYRTSMDEAERLFDAQLADIAAILAVTTGPDAMSGTLDTEPTSISFQVWQDGVLAAASVDVPETPLAAFVPGYSDVNFGGYRWRAYSQFQAEKDRWLIVAQRADIRFALAEKVILESVLPILMGLPLAGILIWLIVGRGLRPLSDLAREMAGKRADDLSAVAGDQPPQELEALVNSINDLLRRLEGAFDREKRFAADAAHELRTPISVLKVQLHNLLRDAGDDASEMRALQAAVDRMGHSVEQVIMLYRTTPEQFAASFAALDPAGMARQVIARLYPQLEAKHQQIELLADDLVMRGDEFALQTLLTNLVENASKYSGENGAIRVSIRRSGAGVKLTVEDSGPGIPEDQRDKVFERFYRVRADRQQSSVIGSGIGLGIVRHIAEIHGATVTLGDSCFPTGLAVNVFFPDVGAADQHRSAS